ncbi:uncharacterized protein LOC102391317 isoform X3 [Bubalus bubalis]|nr:uncharacterized protein LOC102391317 isoform X3 [Bubalus bubalis]
MTTPTSCWGKTHRYWVLCIWAVRHSKTLNSQLEAELSTFVQWNPCLMPLSSLLWVFLAITFSGSCVAQKVTQDQPYVTSQIGQSVILNCRYECLTRTSDLEEKSVTCCYSTRILGPGRTEDLEIWWEVEELCVINKMMKLISSNM